jgi:hypothetical protein
MLTVHPLELLRIEHGRLPEETLFGEERDHVPEAHHLAVAAG